MAPSNLDKIKRRLIRNVARLKKEKLPEDKIWEILNETHNVDCQLLWQRMQALTTKKLMRLFIAEDCTQRVTQAARMTNTDWLMCDLVLVHEPIDVMDLNSDEVPKILVRLISLVLKYNIEVTPPENLVKAWLKLTLEYNVNGRHCSPMLLQRRWFLLKQATRKSFYSLWFKHSGTLNKATSLPSKLMAHVATRHPNLLTHPFMDWEEMVEKKYIVMPECLNNEFNKKKSKTSTGPDLLLMEPKIETIDLVEKINVESMENVADDIEKEESEYIKHLETNKKEINLNDKNKLDLINPKYEVIDDEYIDITDHNEFNLESNLCFENNMNIKSEDDASCENLDSKSSHIKKTTMSDPENKELMDHDGLSNVKIIATSHVSQYNTNIEHSPANSSELINSDPTINKTVEMLETNLMSDNIITDNLYSLPTNEVCNSTSLKESVNNNSKLKIMKDITTESVISNVLMNSELSKDISNVGDKIISGLNNDKDITPEKILTNSALCENAMQVGDNINSELKNVEDKNTVEGVLLNVLTNSGLSQDIMEVEDKMASLVAKSSNNVDSDNKETHLNLKQLSSEALDVTKIEHLAQTGIILEIYINTNKSLKNTVSKSENKVNNDVIRETSNLPTESKNEIAKTNNESDSVIDIDAEDARDLSNPKETTPETIKNKDVQLEKISHDLIRETSNLPTESKNEIAKTNNESDSIIDIDAEDAHDLSNPKETTPETIKNKDVQLEKISHDLIRETSNLSNEELGVAKSMNKYETNIDFDVEDLSDLEFVDEGIEFHEDDFEINDQQNTNVKDSTESESVDAKLLIIPTVYTKKLENMDILKNKDIYETLNINDIIDNILIESKPIYIQSKMEAMKKSKEPLCDNISINEAKTASSQIEELPTGVIKAKPKELFDIDVNAGEVQISITLEEDIKDIFETNVSDGDREINMCKKIEEKDIKTDTINKINYEMNIDLQGKVDDKLSNDGPDTIRFDLGSAFLQKPSNCKYNPIMLCKNPDFNTRLKRLPIGFISIPNNYLMLKACKPLTIDLHKGFETKLIDGVLYLKENNDELNHKQSLTMSKATSTTVSVVPSALPAKSLVDNVKVNIKDLVPAKSNNIDYKIAYTAREEFIKKYIQEPILNLQTPSRDVSQSKDNSNKVILNDMMSKNISTLLVPNTSTQVSSNTATQNSLRKTDANKQKKSFRNRVNIPWFTRTPVPLKVYNDNVLLAMCSVDKMLKHLNKIYNNDSSVFSHETNNIIPHYVQPECTETETINDDNINKPDETAKNENINNKTISSETSQSKYNESIIDQSNSPNKIKQIDNGCSLLENKVDTDKLTNIEKLEQIRKRRRKYCCWIKRKIVQEVFKKIPHIKTNRTPNHTCIINQCNCCCKDFDEEHMLFKIKEYINYKGDNLGRINFHSVKFTKRKKIKGTKFQYPKLEISKSTSKVKESKNNESIEISDGEEINKSNVQDISTLISLESGKISIDGTSTLPEKTYEHSKVYTFEKTSEVENLEHQKLENFDQNQKKIYTENPNFNLPEGVHLILLPNGKVHAVVEPGISRLSNVMMRKIHEYTEIMQNEITNNKDLLSQDTIDNYRTKIINREIQLPTFNSDSTNIINNKCIELSDDEDGQKSHRKKKIRKIDDFDINKVKINSKNYTPILNKECDDKNVIRSFVIRSHKSGRKPIFLGKQKMLLTSTNLQAMETEEHSGEERLTQKSLDNTEISQFNLPKGVNLIISQNGKVDPVIDEGISFGDDVMQKIHEHAVMIQNEISNNKDTSKGVEGVTLENIITQINNVQKEILLENPNVYSKTNKSDKEISKEIVISPNYDLASNNPVLDEISEATNILNESVLPTVTEAQPNVITTENTQINNDNDQIKPVGDGKKSILSDLMEMSGISADDTLAENYTSVIQSNTDFINKDIQVHPNAEIQTVKTNSSKNILELSPITSIAELKYATQHNGSFYSLNLASGQLFSVRIEIKKNTDEKVIEVKRKVKVKSLDHPDDVIEIGDSDDDTERRVIGPKQSSSKFVYIPYPDREKRKTSLLKEQLNRKSPIPKLNIVKRNEKTYINNRTRQINSDLQSKKNINSHKINREVVNNASKSLLTESSLHVFNLDDDSDDEPLIKKRRKKENKLRTVDQTCNTTQCIDKETNNKTNQLIDQKEIEETVLDDAFLEEMEENIQSTDIEMLDEETTPCEEDNVSIECEDAQECEAILGL